jgi:aspartate 1-decarboxylase
MLLQVLKSKIHRAMITDGDIGYEGSIEIPLDLIEAAGLWVGEKVLVASITSGNRLETYVQPGPAGGGRIIITGGAAHRIKKGERVAIMAFALSETPVEARKIVVDEHNRIIRAAR